MPKSRKPDTDHYLAISRAVAGQMDFKKVLGQIAGEVQKLLPHDHMDVTIVEPDRPDYHVAYEVGMETSWGEAVEPQPTNLSPIRQLLFGEVPNIITADAWQDSRFHFEGAFDEPIFDARLHSRMHVPLQIHGEICGALNISSHQRDVYSVHDLNIAQDIADLIAPYFYALVRGQQAEKLARAEGAARGKAEALRQGALRLTEGMERERRRIGMELHDQTLADLTRIYRQVERVNLSAEHSRQDLMQIADDLAQCTRELRRIIEDAKPGILELFGFQQAVEAQLERSVVGVSPEIVTSVEDETGGLLDKCPDPIRTAIFRIVQEATNNAVKHGNCTKISVRLAEENDMLLISVTDNGTGVSGDYAEWVQSTGGLDNMRIRADLISASLEFEDRIPFGGTRVVISLPKSVAANHRRKLMSDIVRQNRNASDQRKQVERSK
ncbi:MAG: ATP-binding protein [Pseudomonadota bacterium]